MCQRYMRLGAERASCAHFDGGSFQVSDVKRLIEPRRLRKEKVGTRGSSTEVAADHLAFDYLAREGSSPSR